MDKRITVPNGTHEARIVSIAFVGTLEKTYKGKTNSIKTILISYEMSEIQRETQDGPIRMVVSKDYSFYLNEKARLRKHIEAILNRSLTDEETDFQNKSGMYRVTDLLGKACNVTVENKEWESEFKSGINTVIKSVGSIPQKYLDGIPKAQRILTSFDIRKYGTIKELQEDQSYRFQNKFVKSKIHSSKEYKRLLEHST
jgi:hypothetical protein